MMSDDQVSSSTPKSMTWAGYVMSALPVAMLFMSAGMKLSGSPQVVDGFKHFGFQEGIALPLALVEFVCTVLYVIPQTSVLGAILLTGYLGGATVTHVRVEEAFIAPIILGVLIWGGLFLRDTRIRALIPVRRKSAN